ncbi:MAG: hypothetical protein ACP5FK_02275 [bacterium]
MKRVAIVFISLLLLFNIIYARTRDEMRPLVAPTTQFKNQNASNIWLTFTNYGFFGNGGEWGTEPYSCVFPAYSNQEYLFQGALWVGAIVGRDTLCTVGQDGWAHEGEMYPGTDPGDTILERSNIPTSPVFDTTAVSELDFIAVYTDTYTDPSIPSMGPWHRPLGLEVRQNSYAWSYSYAEDFIIIDFWVKNIGRRTLREVYIGLYMDGDCGPTGALYEDDKSQDDVTGFISSIPPQYGGNVDNPKDSIKTAWLANAALVGFEGNCAGLVTPDVTGCRVLRTPNPYLSTSFNWWYSNQSDMIADWGPAFPDNPYDVLLNQLNSQFSPGDPQAGTPSYDDPRADVLKWLLMANGAFDPDQLDIRYAYSDTLMNDTRYMFSFGPIYPAQRNGMPVYDSTFQPGDSVPVTVAYIGGENFQIFSDVPTWSGHPNVTGGDTVVTKENSWSPIRYDFTDLGTNARWSLDVYDNPKVITSVPWGDDTITQAIFPPMGPADTAICDTTDPFFHWPVPIVINTDTIDWTGDGIPDFAGPPPPNFTQMMIVPGVPRATDVAILWGKREKVPTDPSRDSLWNILPDEQVSKDPFVPNYEDFQGYRIYKSYSNVEREIAGWTMLRQWDMGFKWILSNPSDPNSNLVEVPNQNYPQYAFAQWLEYDTIRAPNANIYETDYQLNHQLNIDPNFAPLEQYRNEFRYVFVDSNVTLLHPIYYTVTCFDFGNPQTDVEPLESSKGSNAHYIVPSPAPRQLNEDTPVMVVPNPYRGDFDYSSGAEPWEDPARTGWTEHSRRISFINLPEECTIRIYTLTGDLVKVLEHDGSENNSGTEDWNLISNDTQLIASGIYLYAVEEPGGNTQVGKFVVIK